MLPLVIHDEYVRTGQTDGRTPGCYIMLSRLLLDMARVIKGKGFSYSLPNVGPGADPGVQPVSPQVTISHPPGSRLPQLSTRPTVTFPAAKHHRP